MGAFEKYKALKEKMDVTFEGIHLNRVMATLIWFSANGDKRASFSMKNILHLFLSVDIRQLKYNFHSHEILSTFGRYQRKDHLELYESVLQKLGDKVAYNNIMKFGWKVCFHPMIIFRITCLVFRLLRSFSLPFGRKVKLAIYCVHYCNTIKELDKMDFSDVKKYLCLCSVLDLENLLTQYMKRLKIKTYSLEEGIYFIFKKDPPIDSVQYENFEADKLLCWGEYSYKEDLSYGISEDRLSIAGYPKKVKLQGLKPNNSYQKCILLLARNTYDHSNFRLLDILSGYSSEYEFSLKLHPSCNYSSYQQYANKKGFAIVPREKTIRDCLNNEKYDFAIAVNTTAYYEALMNGVPCLRYCDESFDRMAGLDDVFTTAQEFLDTLSRWKMLDNSIYQEEILQILEYVIGYGIDNYKKILLE